MAANFEASCKNASDCVDFSRRKSQEVYLSQEFPLVLEHLELRVSPSSCELQSWQEWLRCAALVGSVTFPSADDLLKPPTPLS